MVTNAKAPPGLLRQAASKTREVLDGVQEEPLTPDLFKQFFELFYSAADTDRHGIENLLQVQPGFAVRFRTAASAFRLIDDDYSETLFVKYGEGAGQLGILKAQGPERWLMRKLQRHAVNIPKWDMSRLVLEGQVQELYPGLFVQITDTLYDSKVGVVTEEDSPAPSLIA